MGTGIVSAIGVAGLSITLSLAVPTEDDSFARGDALVRGLLAGQPAALESAFLPKALAALGGASALRRSGEELARTAGPETAVLDERVFIESGYTSYYRVSRFEKLASVTTRLVWNSDGAIIALSIKPTAQAAEGVPTTYARNVRLHLPLGVVADGVWYVAWGGVDAVDNYHISAGDQRFAYDFVIMRGGFHHSGEGRRNADHYCFGAPVVAPAHGRIIMATDGVADNDRPGVKTNQSTPGNHVVIDHGSDEYSFIAHLKSGSVVVKSGQQVRAGQQIGACGNSGKSDLPHVHYHLQNGIAYGNGIGLPLQFESYALGGRVLRSGEPRRGDLLFPVTTAP